MISTPFFIIAIILFLINGVKRFDYLFYGLLFFIAGVCIFFWEGWF